MDWARTFTGGFDTVWNLDSEAVHGNVCAPRLFASGGIRADFSLLVWAIDAAALPARIDFSLAGGRV